MTSKALIAVDPQRDFCEGGALAVRGGNVVAAGIARHLILTDNEYITRVVTHDFHIDPKGHWSDNPDFVDSWPKHCEAGTDGAKLHTALDNADFDYYLFKGRFNAAYSGFEAYTEAGIYVSMTDILKRHEIDEVDIVGLALDYCVKATALDAVKMGFNTTILTDMTAAVHNSRKQVVETINGLKEVGVSFK